jgi:hypothetical protein
MEASVKHSGSNVGVANAAYSSNQTFHKEAQFGKPCYYSHSSNVIIGHIG